MKNSVRLMNKDEELEKIENKYDLEYYNNAINEYKNNPKTYTIDEIKNKLEL